MRIAFCDAYPHLQGGAQQLTHLLLTGLRERGDEVVLVVPGTGPLPRAVARDGVPVRVVPAGRALGEYGGPEGGIALVRAAAALPGYWNRARRALADVDLVHVNDHRGMVLYAPAARMAGIPVVWHRHALPPAPGLDQVARLADVVVAPSPPGESLPGHASVEVVPGVVPVPDHPWEPAAHPLVVCVARLHPRKGQDVLLRAAVRVRADHPELEVALVGGSDPAHRDYERTLRTLASAPPLDGAVTFHGHVDDPWVVGARAHVYVQPSLPGLETQGLALRQALSLGLPVVASHLPPFRIATEDGRTGLVVPPGDESALADAMASLLADPGRASALGEAARARADDAGGADEMIDAVRAVHRQALGRSR